MTLLKINLSLGFFLLQFYIRQVFLAASCSQLLHYSRHGNFLVIVLRIRRNPLGRFIEYSGHVGVINDYNLAPQNCWTFICCWTLPSQLQTWINFALVQKRHPPAFFSLRWTQGSCSIGLRNNQTFSSEGGGSGLGSSFFRVRWRQVSVPFLLSLIGWKRFEWFWDKNGVKFAFRNACQDSDFCYWLTHWTPYTPLNPVFESVN